MFQVYGNIEIVEGYSSQKFMWKAIQFVGRI